MSNDIKVCLSCGVPFDKERACKHCLREKVIHKNE